MVFVNQEFCRATGYSKEEATGRNCELLQGKRSERDAISLMGSAIAKGQGWISFLRNYKRDGTQYQNLVGLKPIYDCNGLYRFMIGFLYEVNDSSPFKLNLLSLDRLLMLLPSQLDLKSCAAATLNASLAVKTSGEPNSNVLTKSALVAQAMQEEKFEIQFYQKQGRPKPAGPVVQATSLANLDLTATIFSFTKITWLNTPMDAMKLIAGDPIGREMFSLFCSITSTVYHTHFEFCCYCEDIAKLQVSA